MSYDVTEPAEESEVAVASNVGNPVSILDVLGVMPDGRPGARITPVELGAYLKLYLGTDAEQKRNHRHALRDELYRDGGKKHMDTVLDKLFRDREVRDLRKAFVEHTRFNNVMKRIVNEISTIYAEPAKRSVKSANDVYQDVLERCRIDEKALLWSRMANLHRVVVVGFRVRQLPNGLREPVLDVITPANVRVILHPNDNTLPIGYLVRVSMRPSRSLGQDMPVWTLWTDYETAQLREDMTVIGGTYVEHGLRVCPFVPINLGIDEADFWPGHEGEDLVAAQTSTWLTNILLLKETKSATKQQIISGDGSNTARGQAADTEIAGELAEGQSSEVVDISMEPKQFTDVGDHILDCTGNNYGFSPAMARHQGVQSAAARDLMLIPLKEIRRNQRTPFARFEARLVVVMALVLTRDMPELAFDPAGWRAEFCEAQTPLSQQDYMDLFLEERQASLSNTIDFWLERHPGATEVEAWLAIQRNIDIETERVTRMKKYLAASGQASPISPDGNGNPQQPTKAAAEPAPPGPPKFDADGNVVKGGGYS